MKDYTYDDRGAPLTPRQIIEPRATKEPDSIAFQYKRKKQLVTVTCGQLWREVNALGVRFCESGLHNARIAVLGENSYEWILTWLAAVLSGNVIVPLDKDQPPEELSGLLMRCETELLVCSKMYLDVAQRLKADGAAQNILSMEELPALAAGGGDLDSLGVAPAADTICAIIFTSGTTGEQKGVMLTRRNIASNVISSCSVFSYDAASVLTLPMHHTFGFTVGVLAAYINGYPIYISRGIRYFSDEIKSVRPEGLVLVPLYVETMYKRIWSAAKEQGSEKKLRNAIRVSNTLRKVGIDMRRKLFRAVLDPFGGELKAILCGGAFLDQKYIDGMADFGIDVVNGYGITECSPVVSVNRVDNRRRNSVGLPVPGVEVRIIDGEICVRGDNVMAGYLRDPESTAAVMEDGWFHTGDMGDVDEDGFLYITGRKKNLIILSNGENVSAEELELKLMEIEHVEEVVVRQEEDGITAEIYAENRSGIDEAVEALNRKLPPFKRISRIKYRDEEFEKTTSRKIKRHYEEAERVKENV